MTAERLRLDARAREAARWKHWGPYLSERQWGSVREDYSAGGNAWDSFPHDHARSRAYRWGEDGIGGISDRHGELCFAIALWNGKDPILKERLFGLTNGEGNHGEDVKEYYFYLDNTPTHSWMRYLYKYPQEEFPYGSLAEENRSRGKDQPEFELLDTGVFDDDRYFDVFIDYAKSDPEDISIRITVINRGPEAAVLDVLPSLWLRNTWSWADGKRGRLAAVGDETIRAHSGRGSARWLHCYGADELIFTENDTNSERLFGVQNESEYVKDGFHDYVVGGRSSAVNPERVGSKAAARYRLEVPAGGSRVVKLRLCESESAPLLDASYDALFETRKDEADEFYAEVAGDLSDEQKQVQRQAFSSLLWSKQHYYFDVKRWLDGDPAQPPPPAERRHGRNTAWQNLHADDVILMPDKWEYPWFAAWDWAFHCVTMAELDPAFAKHQLLLLTREWYMHANGQLPAYEWAFGDVNPPVQAWAVLEVYRTEKRLTGKGDRHFLERMFHKLVMNFGWWVNRKDMAGDNLFQGGFLGLDNISIFDRSQPLPTGGYLEQADGTAWMALYSLNVFSIALELAAEDRAYEDMVLKFFEHFLQIVHAMNNLSEHHALWDEEDGFYYDMLAMPDGREVPLRVRSIVGLIPLFVVHAIDPEDLAAVPRLEEHLEWIHKHRGHLAENVADLHARGEGDRRLMAVVRPEQLRRLARWLLDEDEFLSPFGVRALSRYHRDNPYTLELDGGDYSIDYEPAESTSGLFGGNSNWRGPIWFPVNFLLIESLRQFHRYYGDELRVESPVGSGTEMNLGEVADELSRRLVSIFLPDSSGERPVYGGTSRFQHDPHWRDHLLFYEYFHGDNGAGIGASHQTGWTALVAVLLQRMGRPTQGKGSGASDLTNISPPPQDVVIAAD